MCVFCYQYVIYVATVFLPVISFMGLEGKPLCPYMVNKKRI